MTSGDEVLEIALGLWLYALAVVVWRKSKAAHTAHAKRDWVLAFQAFPAVINGSIILAQGLNLLMTGNVAIFWLSRFSLVWVYTLVAVHAINGRFNEFIDEQINRIATWFSTTK